MYSVRANTENGNITAPLGFEQYKTELISEFGLPLIRVIERDASVVASLVLHGSYNIHMSEPLHTGTHLNCTYTNLFIGHNFENKLQCSIRLSTYSIYEYILSRVK
jgi:hypothetical protein